MKSNAIMLRLAVAIIVLVLPACQSAEPVKPSQSNASPTFEPRRSADMDLGNFSVSLTVKDLPTSRAFYEKLGFTQVAGNPAQNWIVLKNGHARIGLFQGMFEKNMLTFNPGWDGSGKNIDPFTDVREIQRRLKELGITLTLEADPSTTGPAAIMLVDPDGNPILIDQHR